MQKSTFVIHGNANQISENLDAHRIQLVPIIRKSSASQSPSIIAFPRLIKHFAMKPENEFSQNGNQDDE